MGDIAVAAASEVTMAFGDLRSKHGYAIDELASWLQKDVRRSAEPGDVHERGALFAATELDLSGYSAYCWRRLEVIASEDIGPAEPQLPAVLAALRRTFEETRRRDRKERPVETSNAMLQLVHAVLLLCRARKSRVVDDACAVFYVGERPAMEVPEYALDAHTKRGHELGRHGRSEAEYESSYGIANEPPDAMNPYHDEAKRLALAPARRSSRRWLLGELHREYARLDAVHGDGRRWSLELAGGELGRLLSSSRELSDDECSWLLERLRTEPSD